MVFIYKIDYEKIKDNILQLDKNDYLVLKSNAYGFGFEEVLDIAYVCGIRKYCILEEKDAISIKKKYPDTRVLLLGPFSEKYLNLYEQHQIEISITDEKDFDIIKKYNIPFQIEINSGMNRFGINNIDTPKKISDERFRGIYSHNATNDINHVNNQLQTFFQICKNILNKEIHFASTAIKHLNIPFTNSRRIGCAIYADALSVYGKIIKINHCNKGSYLGYDYSYQFDKDSYIGVVDIGYADGLERKCEGFLVYINGKFFPLIGRSCMNHSFVLLDDNCYLDERVIFIGKNNVLDNYLRYFGKIPHEVYLSFLKKY